MEGRNVNKSKMSLQALTKAATVYVNFAEEKWLSTLVSLNVYTFIYAYVEDGKCRVRKQGEFVVLWFDSVWAFRLPVYCGGWSIHSLLSKLQGK